ncbi:CD225/dispanin family protein [Nocardiopsis tropica]|jgi:hypothetical protein|uniref:CD225/dispanin family protein n=1 Tax=Nocardiopsis tropica TaxID=109330 RepID=A0ABU7KTD4_9ACTN|nr:CD225/dispanin family protein [Nocardiopsis umidischolae]MEE2052342.1 CD225/dispanin family protein [Nocardiopsis umidischolae]
MSYGPPTGGYGPPSGGYGPPAGYGGAPGYGGPPAGGPPKNYLMFNILGIFGCTVIGIIGLIFALQVNSKWESGDYAGAQSSAQVAKIMGIIGLIGFICVVLYLLFVLLMFIVAFGATATY